MLLLQLLSGSFINKEQVSTSSFIGLLFIQELLNGSSSIDLFLHGNKHLNIEEEMVMFLMTISHNLRNQLIKTRFQHSRQTIHKYFHKVLVAMVKFSKEIITLSCFNNSSNGIFNCQLKQIFKVYHFLLIILHIIFVLFSYKNNYLYFKKLLSCKVLLV